MAQGAGKSIKAKGKSGGSQRKNTGKTKPGKREVAPKDRQRVLERSQKKVNLCWLSLYKQQNSRGREIIAEQRRSTSQAKSIILLRSRWYRLPLWVSSLSCAMLENSRGKSGCMGFRPSADLVPDSGEGKDSKAKGKGKSG